MELNIRDLKHIGEKIHNEREKIGISVYRLAQVSGIAPNLLTKIEEGRSCRVDTLSKIWDAFDTIEKEKSTNM